MSTQHLRYGYSDLLFGGLILLGSASLGDKACTYHCGHYIRNIGSHQHTCLQLLRTRASSNDVSSWSSLSASRHHDGWSVGVLRRKRLLPSQIVSGSPLLLSLLGLSRLSFRLWKNYSTSVTCWNCLPLNVELTVVMCYCACIAILSDAHLLLLTMSQVCDVIVAGGCCQFQH